MELEKLFLKKEELPILYETCFQVPIHPKLFDENIKINKKIAKEIFPKAAEDWYRDLKDYIKIENPKNKDWIKRVFLKEKPKITKMYGHQYFKNWEDLIFTSDNGLVHCFSINRDEGGSIYFDKIDFNCKALGTYYIKFSDEKRKEFQSEKENKSIFVYAQHNINHFPGALFLRNWAILYMNKVFKEVF